MKTTEAAEEKKMTINFKLDAVGDIDVSDAMSQLDSVQMVGTDKQISWAVDIRRKALHEIVTMYNSMLDTMRLRQQAPSPANVSAALAGIDKLANITSAKFWVDNRSELPKTLLGKYGR